MYEFHGWATLEERGSDELAAASLARVSEGARLLCDEIRTVDVRRSNGAWHVCLSGLQNHRGNGDIEQFFVEIGTIAPGSYGVLSIHDDEDRNFGDLWRRHILHDGTVHVDADLRLSRATRLAG